MDTDDVEVLTLNALGGIDTVTINDLEATDVSDVAVNLGVNGAGDASADAVTLNGTVGADAFVLSGSAGSVAVERGEVDVSLTNTEPANDTLTVNASGGNDLVGASTLASSSVVLTVNAGSGDDVVVGSQGNDSQNGEAGNDFLSGGDGNDALDGGTGTDIIDGGAGIDTAANGETVVNVP
jgi:Ca2+-binding RTX toxin-like protein